MITFDKLHRLITKRGLVIKCVYTIDKMCVYIELVNLTNAHSFLLYIPSAYTIKPHRNLVRHKIKQLDVDMSNNMAIDYSTNMENMDEMYNEVELSHQKEVGKDIVKELEKAYDRPVELNNTSAVPSLIKDYYRQLTRLKLCTKHLKYKVGILHGQYLCIINRYDDIDCYYISLDEDSKHEKQDAKLYGSIDLEYYIENVSNIEVEIKNVVSGVCLIIDKTQNKHASRLNTIITDNILNIKSILDVKSTKEKYVGYIEKLEQLLDKVNSAENEQLAGLKQIEDKTSTNYVSDDIHKTKIKRGYEKELDKLNKVKQEIVLNLMTVRGKHDDLSLFVDRLMFDNIVMLKVVMDNVAKIKHYLVNKN